jgi:hypothetical protein
MNPNPIERPSVLELSGAELLTELPRLQGQGATVFGMTAVCVSRYRLFLRWPEPEQGELLKTGFSAKQS